MDNTQDTSTTGPSQGQPETTGAQVPSTDAGSNASGSVVGTAPQTPSEGAKVETFEVPDKFRGKSAEEIAKAYVELESHNKKVEMDKAELEKLFVPPTENAPEKAAAPEQKEETQTQDPFGEVVRELTPRLREEFGKMLSPVLAKIEVREMVEKYGEDFKAHAKEVKALVDRKPSLTLEEAYQIASFGNLKRTAQNEGLVRGQQTQEQAQKARVESSRPSGYRVTSIEDAVADKNVPLTEIAEALGPEYAKAFGKYLKKN